MLRVGETAHTAGNSSPLRRPWMLPVLPAVHTCITNVLLGALPQHAHVFADGIRREPTVI